MLMPHQLACSNNKPSVWILCKVKPARLAVTKASHEANINCELKHSLQHEVELARPSLFKKSSVFARIQVLDPAVVLEAKTYLLLLAIISCCYLYFLPPSLHRLLLF